MKGLLLKDLYNMKGIIRLYLLFPIVSAVLGYIDNSLTFLTTLPIFTCIFFVISAFAYDEYSHFNEYALTLPLGRKELVKSKYLLSIVILVTMLIMVAILLSIMIICFPSKFPDFNLVEQMVSILSFAAVILIILAIQFPIIFRYGTEKARVLMIICFLGITALCGFILQSMDIPLRSLNISDMNMLVFILIGFVASIIIYICSYFLSYRLILKKEY